MTAHSDVSNCRFKVEQAEYKLAPETMNMQDYTYRVTWSPEDGQHVGLCTEFASLSWLDQTPEAALKGIQKLVAQVVVDMQAQGEQIPAFA